MNGMTITEMATALNLPRKTVEMRLLRAGFTPITKEAIYSTDAFEAIKKTSGPGRPPKAKPETKKPTKPAKPPKK